MGLLTKNSQNIM